MVAIMVCSGDQSTCPRNYKIENVMAVIFKYRITLGLGTGVSHIDTISIEMTCRAKKARCFMMAYVGTVSQCRSSN